MVNKIKLQPESLDCSIIEESQEIILIDDDEDEEKDKEKNIVQDVNEKESSITNISLNSTVGSISTKCSNEKLKTGNDKFNNTQISHITQSNNNNEDNPKNTNNIKGSITSKMPILNNQIEENKENKDKQISTHIKEGNSNILLNVLNSNENEIIGKVNNETTNQLYKNYTILYETLTDEIINTKPSSVKTNNKNDSIICLDDDSIIEESVSNMSSCSSSGTNHTYKDDSVIFVSEIINLDKFKPSTSKALDYIPLELPTSYTQHRKQKLDEREINNQTSYNTPVRKRIGGDLFTASERKKLINYNTNTYNPNKEIDVQPKTGKRMVLIDGSNVAFHHALNQRFSVKGLEICLEYFEKIGHDVKAIVPQFRLQQGKSTNPAQLEKLHRSGKIVFTPCKNLPGKYASSYDDRFLLQLASELDAAIISNDNYRDLINENPAFKKIIENRVIGYSWCNDMFILPKDPYGRLGPNLNIILNRN